MKAITRRSFLKRISLIAVSNALPFFTGPSIPFALGAEPQPKPSERELAATARIARQFMGQYKVPGLSVAIARHGQLVYAKAFGYADKAAGERLTPSHLFRIASVTKPITSVAIFSLIEQRRLRLNDLIFGSRGVLHFDYGKTYPALVKEITLYNLLTHTCGGWDIDKADPMFLNPAMNHRELIEWTIRHQPLRNVPGKHYAYSNFGYCILGRVLEKVTGQPYAQFVKQHVLARGGIKNMRLAGNTLAQRVRGEVRYYGQNGENPYNMNVRRMDSHGGWIGTPIDLVRFLIHVDGFSFTTNILRLNTIKTMTTPSAANSNYACGWAVNEVPNWWHNGSLPGTTTIVVRTASGLCWAAFTNTRAKGMDLAIDRMMWKMAKAVPAWRA
ncbi:MAG: serine hydrolase domain-containing protein [Desulfomonilaceae bacterium]